MKRLNQLLLISALLGALVSCSHQEVNYEDALPAHVQAAVRISASGDNPLFRIPLVNQFVTPIEQLKGLDLTRPIYLFQLADKQYGLVAHVQDKDALTNSLQNATDLPFHAETQVTEDVVVALYAPDLTTDSAQAILTQWLAQTSEQSLLQQPAWKWLTEEDKLINGRWTDYRFYIQKEQSATVLHLWTPEKPDLIGEQWNQYKDQVNLFITMAKTTANLTIQVDYDESQKELQVSAR